MKTFKKALAVALVFCMAVSAVAFAASPSLTEPENNEEFDSNVITVAGSVTPNEEVTLLVVKGTVANKDTIAYVSQKAADADGSFSFDFAVPTGGDYQAWVGSTNSDTKGVVSFTYTPYTEDEYFGLSARKASLYTLPATVALGGKNRAVLNWEVTATTGFAAGYDEAVQPLISKDGDNVKSAYLSLPKYESGIFTGTGSAEKATITYTATTDYGTYSRTLNILPPAKTSTIMVDPSGDKLIIDNGNGSNAALPEGSLNYDFWYSIKGGAFISVKSVGLLADETVEEWPIAGLADGTYRFYGSVTNKYSLEANQASTNVISYTIGTPSGEKKYTATVDTASSALTADVNGTTVVDFEFDLKADGESLAATDYDVSYVVTDLNANKAAGENGVSGFELGIGYYKVLATYKVGGIVVATALKVFYVDSTPPANYDADKDAVLDAINNPGDPVFADNGDGTFDIHIDIDGTLTNNDDYKIAYYLYRELTSTGATKLDRNYGRDYVIAQVVYDETDVNTADTNKFLVKIFVKPIGDTTNASMFSEVVTKEVE